MKCMQFQAENRQFVSEPAHRKWNDGKGSWSRCDRLFDRVWSKLNRSLVMRHKDALPLTMAKLLSLANVTREEWEDVSAYVKERSPETWKVFKTKLDQLEKSETSSSRAGKAKRS